MTWLALDTAVLRDERVAYLAEIYGPQAPLLWIALLCQVKEDGEAGTAHVIYRRLAADAFLESPERVGELLENMASQGLIELQEHNPPASRATVTVTGWAKWQECYAGKRRDRTNAARQARFRERKRQEAEAAASRNAVTNGPTGTETTTETPKDEGGSSPPAVTSLLPPDSEEGFVSEIVARFNDAAAERNITVDARLIQRALADHKHAPPADVKRVAFKCADWLGQNAPRNGAKPRSAHLTLRKFLDDLPPPREEPSGRSFTHVRN